MYRRWQRQLWGDECSGLIISVKRDMYYVYYMDLDSSVIRAPVSSNTGVLGSILGRIINVLLSQTTTQQCCFADIA